MVGIYSLLLVMMVSVVSYAANGSGKTIFGEDNRLEIYQAKNPIYLSWAHSTAAMVAKTDIVTTSTPVSTQTSLKGVTLESTGVCKSEPFSDQIIPSSCTGFLVSPNVLATAGHCIADIVKDCEDYAWVFDFHMVNSTRMGRISTQSIYHCKRVIVSIDDQESWADHALIELDRTAVGRLPLKFRKSGTIEQGAELAIVGHPLGLPKKIADDATVTSVHENYFVANLDSYGGNSGSPVFNLKSGLVEGILVRGEEDWITTDEGCTVSLKLDDQDPKVGQEVAFITNIKELFNDL